MLTKYQEAQLLHRHTTGEFVFIRKNGNKVSRQAFVKMLDVLEKLGMIDGIGKNIVVTEKGKKFCSDNHMSIDLSVLH